MSIDIEPRNLGAVVQLVAKSDGWRPEETRYRLTPTYIGGDPKPPIADHTPENLKELLRAAWLTTREKRPTDFNGLKVAVQSLSVTDGMLQTDGVVTDYFTAWGLPKADDSKDLFAEHERQIVINRKLAPDAVYETTLPWAVCTHNVLLDSNGDILMMVRSQSQGFHAGRVSVTEEEQMDPDIDVEPFNAAYRSYWEELGLIVPPQTLRLLGVAMEIGAAYPAYCFIGNTDNVARRIVERWKGARDYKESTALFAVPMTEIDQWSGLDEVRPDVWHKHLLSGDIAPDAILKLHATSSWRIELAKQYTKSSST